MSGLAGAVSLITLDGVLINLGYGLMLLALLARDILWLRACEVRAFSGELLAQGEANDRLIVLTDGEVRVVVHGHDVATLGPGDLVAEMSFLTQEPTSAAVVADKPVSYRYWTRVMLERTRLRKPALWSKLQAAIGRDLVRKIRQVDSQAAPQAESELRGNTTT